MNIRDNPNLLDAARKCAIDLGDIISQHIPEESRLALFTALLEHLDTKEHNERTRLLRVFESGILEGINRSLANKFTSG